MADFYRWYMNRRRSKSWATKRLLAAQWLIVHLHRLTSLHSDALVGWLCVCLQHSRQDMSPFSGAAMMRLRVSSICFPSMIFVRRYRRGVCATRSATTTDRLVPAIGSSSAHYRRIIWLLTTILIQFRCCTLAVWAVHCQAASCLLYVMAEGEIRSIFKRKISVFLIKLSCLFHILPRNLS